MAVFFPGKFLYLAHTRVASRATSALLQNMGGIYVDTGQSGGGRGHHAHFYDAVKHCDYSGETVVCTVRNHFDALVTWWLSFNRKNNNSNSYSFYQFLCNLVERDTTFMTLFDNGQIKWFYRHLRWSNYILRYETLQEDLDTLFEIYNLPKSILPRINVSEGRKPTGWYYTQDSRNKVRQLFHDEMQELQYSWSNRGG